MFLIELARKAIEKYLHEGKILEIPLDEVPSKYRQKGAVFVTLKKEGKLRGCIGSVIPFEPLYKNVIRNALNAAFDDPRFPPLKPEELDDLEISISILSPPKEYFYENLDELCHYLESHKPGVILRIGDRQALFLPSVWQELPSCQLFLSALCQKAGLDGECWQDAQAQFFLFHATELKEA